MAKSRRSNGKSALKELAEFDGQLKENGEQTEDEIFNRQERLMNLRGGKFAREKDTIFSVIFQELKKRKNRRER